ncbi:MAG TPA: DUF4288 domain-containing protein [Thermoanaerobaculia bacterium]
MPATLHNLDRYNLEISDLPALGDRPVELSGSLRGIPYEPLFPLPPAERNRRLKEHLETALERLRARWPGGTIRPRSEDLPWNFDSVVPARELPRILRFRELNCVFVERIQGFRKRPERKPLQWYAVRARIVIQVEDQTRGMQSVEDRIVLVQGRSFEDAERRLQPEWEQYAEPYLNPNGEMVRWQFEEVLDVYEIGTLDLDPKGTEVYSRLSQRRARAGAVWRPRNVDPET